MSVLPCLKKTTQGVALALISSLSFSGATLAQTLNSNEQKASYSIGVELGQNLRNQGLELETDAFIAGLRDVLKDNSLRLTVAEMDEAIDQFRDTLEQRQQAQLQEMADKNRKEGEAFLAQNKNEPGVETLASGLQYRILEAGDGEKPNPEDVIIAHYQGRLIDGTQFDSSYARGVPIEFELDNVIQGWQEALKMMPAGSRWEIFVPSDLAYGERGAGSVIGPNQVLIFEIHFITTAVLD